MELHAINEANVALLYEQTLLFKHSLAGASLLGSPTFSGPVGPEFFRVV
jgi:hypothetical protein